MEDESRTVDSETIIDFIEQTAEMNISSNAYHLNNAQDGVVMGSQYLAQYQTAISRDIGLVTDKLELMEELHFALGKAAYLSTVLRQYIAETDRHIDAEINEMIIAETKDEIT